VRILFRFPVAIVLLLIAAASLESQHRPPTAHVARSAEPHEAAHGAGEPLRVPRLVDITASTGIHFNHLAA